MRTSLPKKQHAQSIIETVFLSSSALTGEGGGEAGGEGGGEVAGGGLGTGVAGGGGEGDTCTDIIMKAHYNDRQGLSSRLQLHAQHCLQDLYRDAAQEKF